MNAKESDMGNMAYAVFSISATFNITYLVVIARRRRLRTGHYALMAALAVVDLTIGGLWSCLVAHVLRTGWVMEPEVCRFQSYAQSLAQMLSAFLLAAVAVERVLYMLKPSRHAVMSTFKPVAFLVVALLVFCSVVASIHLYGSVPIMWLPDARACDGLFAESLQLLDMTFCMDHAIPFWAIAMPALVASFLKFALARRTSVGEIILETNVNAPGDSYSSRLSDIQAKFNSATSTKTTTTTTTTTKKKKPSLGKRVYTRWGCSEPHHWDSDVEEGESGEKVGSGNYKVQRVYVLPITEFLLLVTSATCIGITALFWLPWVVCRQRWNHRPLDDGISEEFSEMAVVCMHLASGVKFVVYTAVNPYFRSALLKTIYCGRNVYTGDEYHFRRK